MYADGSGSQFYGGGRGRLIGAEFVAADNGDLCGDASYEDRKVALYRGSASVVICLKAVRGKTKVRAMAEGLDMAEVALRFDAV